MMNEKVQVDNGGSQNLYNKPPGDGDHWAPNNIAEIWRKKQTPVEPR